MILMKPHAGGMDGKRLHRIDAWMARWVENSHLPNLLVAIQRKGRLVYLRHTGLRDVEAELPVEEDTLYRIFSMTKPVTTVAAMMLYEQAKFQLDDPVEKFLPAFASQKVFVGGNEARYDTEPLERAVTVRDLMLHTSGLTYGFHNETVVDAIYREREIDFNFLDNPRPLSELCDRLAELPLLFQPGSRWNYGVSTDVLGRLVEVWSGLSLDEFFRQRIFDPLAMEDTGFSVPDHEIDRLGACYYVNESGNRERHPIADPGFREPPVTLSGGGGLVSTARDYLRFCQCLLNGGAYLGERILGRKTIELMLRNHLPGDLASMGQPRFSEMPYDGIGFGLGGSILLDPAKANVVGSPGEFAWGGMASTAFFIDPSEDLAAVLMTQLVPSSLYPIRRDLRALVYQAIVD